MNATKTGKLWRVEVRQERVAEFYIDADSYSEAQEQADEIVPLPRDFFGGLEADEDCSVFRQPFDRTELEAGIPIWAGGPSGAWESA